MSSSNSAAGQGKSPLAKLGLLFLAFAVGTVGFITLAVIAVVEQALESVSCVTGIIQTVVNPLGVNIGSISDLSIVQGGQTVKVTLDAEQKQNAATAIAVAKAMNLPKQASVLGVAAGYGESKLHNLPNQGAKNNFDSIGVLQQRPSVGSNGKPHYGTPDQIMDVSHAFQIFYLDMLHNAPNYASMVPTLAIHATQNNKDPNYYTPFIPLAETIVDAAFQQGPNGTTQDPNAPGAPTGPAVSSPTAIRLRPKPRQRIPESPASATR
jgi:hypothetical protein